MKAGKYSFQKKLKQYSVLVAPLIASTKISSAQIVYHYCSPELFYKDSIAGDNYTTPAFLDLDGDGTFDVEFAVWSSVQSNNGPNKVHLAAARQFGAAENAIMGYTNLFSATFCTTALPLYCPSALNQGKLVEPAAHFWQVAGTANLGTLVRYFKDIPSANNFVGQWNNLSDRYLGLRFRGGDSKTHYGWIRMDVTKSPASILIKDWAYESGNEIAIEAGYVGNVGISTVDPLENFSITINGGILKLIINDQNYKEVSVTITNVIGQILFRQSLNESNTPIDLHQYEEGIFLVTIHRGEEMYSKKISFQ